MDITNSDMWRQEWTAFWSAPYIILPFIVLGWLGAWWFRGRTTEGEIKGLKREISVRDRETVVWDQQLKLSERLVAASDRDRDELYKKFQDYKAEVAAKGSNASPAKVDAAIQQLKADDALITHALKVARQATLKADVAELMNGVNKQLGLAPPGMTLNSISDDIKKR